MTPPIHPRSILTRATKVPVWADVMLRMGLAVGLIFIVILIHWWDRSGLIDHYDGEVSFLDVVYFTVISVTTTGFGDIAPVSDRARFIESIIVTPVRVAVIFIFVGTAYSFVIKRSWENWRMAQIQKRLDGHFVILGFGTSGSEAACELIQRGTDPANIVVVDQSQAALDLANEMGCNSIFADATRDNTLQDIRIDKAAFVIVSAGRDDTSILIVLTVRHLAPDIPISVVVRASDNELLARQAGATNVINPVSFAGLLLASSCHGEHITSYLADLATASGRVILVERAVKKHEIGGTLRDLPDGLGVRLYRDNAAYGFWEPEAMVLQEGDIIVEIVPNRATSANIK
jgi:voltage-gated potassium channel